MQHMVGGWEWYVLLWSIRVYALPMSLRRVHKVIEFFLKMRRKLWKVWNLAWEPVESPMEVDEKLSIEELITFILWHVDRLWIKSVDLSLNSWRKGPRNALNCVGQKVQEHWFVVLLCCRRAVAQRCPVPQMHNLISIGGQHQGMTDAWRCVFYQSAKRVI